jgi:Family of unknown function (DUF6165)
MSELVHISIGELWDKYSILLIKKEKITDAEKTDKVLKEIQFLNKNVAKYNCEEDEFFVKLKCINEILWNVEDEIRIKEKNQLFDEDFIQLARTVYFKNDERADIKRQINIKFNSNIQEIKEYVDYR